MSQNLGRRVKALEARGGLGDAAQAQRWSEWDRDGRKGPEPRGREALNRLYRRALLEMATD